jgi:hypothetical protein
MSNTYNKTEGWFKTLKRDGNHLTDDRGNTYVMREVLLSMPGYKERVYIIRDKANRNITLNGISINDLEW